MKFNTISPDEYDIQLCQEFYSGILTYDKYINHHKYANEKILSIISLPTSLIQVGIDWVRYVPLALPSPESCPNDNIVFFSVTSLLCQTFSGEVDNKNSSFLEALSPKQFNQPAFEYSSRRDSVSSAKRINGSDIKYQDTIFKSDFRDERFDFSERILPALLKLISVPDPSVPQKIETEKKKTLNITFDLPITVGHSKTESSKKHTVTNRTAAAKRVENRFKLHDNLLLEKLHKSPYTTLRNKRRANKLESRRYPTVLYDSIPSAQQYEYWEAFTKELKTMTRDQFINIALDMFKASRTLGQSLPPEIDFTLNNIEICRRALRALRQYYHSSFETLPPSKKFIYNLSLYVLGSKASKLSPKDSERLTNEFKDLESIQPLSQLMKLSKDFSLLWNREIPLDRIGNITLDMIQSLIQLTQEDLLVLQRALTDLDHRF